MSNPRCYSIYDRELRKPKVSYDHRRLFKSLSEYGIGDALKKLEDMLLSGVSIDTLIPDVDALYKLMDRLHFFSPFREQDQAMIRFTSIVGCSHLQKLITNTSDLGFCLASLTKKDIKIFLASFNSKMRDLFSSHKELVAFFQVSIAEKVSFYHQSEVIPELLLSALGIDYMRTLLPEIDPAKPYFPYTMKFYHDLLGKVTIGYADTLEDEKRCQISSRCG